MDIDALTKIIALAGEVIVLAGTIVPLFVSVGKIKNGMKCQLRSDMLRIYYHNRAGKTIRQYEYENFLMLYAAYKALKGNSFIDKIYAEIKAWDVIS